MIEAIQITNFQKHEKLTLDLSAPITTIVGPSDAGKSAIIRALYWSLLNRPSGEAFLRKGADRVVVRVRIDGKVIRRERGTANLYKLGSKSFLAFGSEVPPAIAAHSRMTEINFQLQHDGPFWFSLSPGQISRELNKIVDLEAMDKAMSRMASVVKESRTKLSLLLEQRRDARKKRDKLAWTTEAWTDLSLIKELGVLLQTQRSKIAKITSFVGDLRRQAVLCNKTTETHVAGKSALNSRQSLDEHRIRMGLVSETLVVLKRSKRQIRVPDISELNDNVAAIERFAARRKLLAVVLSTARILTTDAEASRDLYEAQHKKLHTLEKEGCPVCHKPM